MSRLTDEERKVRRRAASRRYREANRERRNEASRKWREANPLNESKKAIARDRARKWQEAHPARAKEIKRIWHEEHKARANDASRAYHEKIKADPDLWAMKLERDRRHREENRDYYRQWAKDNPEKRRACEHRREARKRGNGGSYTADEWLALCEEHGDRCLRCGVVCKVTVDHVVPLSRGGRNDIENIQPLCMPCNSSKRVKSTDYRPLKQAALL